MNRRPFLQRFHLRCDMSEYADLRWNLPLLHKSVQGFQTADHRRQCIIHRIQSDDRIADPVGQSFPNAGQNSLRAVRGVIRLQSGRQSPGLTDGCITVRIVADFGSSLDQIQITHEFGRRGDHFRRQAPAEAMQFFRSGFRTQNVFPQLRHRPILDGSIDPLVDIAVNNAGHFILFEGNYRVQPQIFERQLRQYSFGCNPFRGIFSCNSGQNVPGLEFIRFCQYVLDAFKSKSLTKQTCFQLHSFHNPSQGFCLFNGRKPTF